MLNHPPDVMDRPGQYGDPLTDVLSLVGVRSAPAMRFELAGGWAIHFPGTLPVEFGAVVEGECWLSPPGGAEQVRLQAGDCYILNGGQAYGLDSAPDVAAVHVNELVAHHRGADGVVRAGTGERTVVVSGGFQLQTNADLLLDLLPPMFSLRAGDESASVLRAILDVLARETAAPRPGAELVTESLAQIILVQVLRGYAASTECAPGAWLGAFADQRIGEALRLIHGDVLRRWTLPELAAAVHMSRSSFALRFKTLVERAPLDYLLRWRMRRAGHVLRTTSRTVSSVALEYGYPSESAFSGSFKRALGCSPKQYRSRATAPATLNDGMCLVDPGG